MYVGNNYVVCVHPRPLRELGRARGRFLSRDEFVCSSPANVAHAVLDAVVDEYLPIMNRLSAMVDGIEEELFEEDEDVPVSVLESLFHLKHELDRPAPPRRSPARRRGPLDKALRPTPPGGNSGVLRRRA